MAGTDNNDANRNNIIFTIKDTDLYVPVVNLSRKGNQKLSKILSNGFARSVYRNECKRKRENKDTTNGCRFFLQSNFVGVKRLSLLVYLNRYNDVKRYKARSYFLPKGVSKKFIYQKNTIKNYRNFLAKDLND